MAGAPEEEGEVKRVLLTGGTGFVGANLARRLLAEGHEVHLLVRRAHDPWRLADLAGRFHWHPVGLAGCGRLAALVRELRPHWVFHLAAHGAYPAQTDVRRMVHTNLLGTIHLVEACLAAGFEAFVHTGSSSEYGHKGQAPAEEERLEPNSAYAVTKASATMYCRHVARAWDAPFVTLRLYSVYGPFEEPTRLIPTLIREGMRGRLPPLARAAIARDFVFTDDVTDAYLRAAAHAGERRGAIYNVGTGVQTSLRAVVEVARKVLGIAAEPVWGSMPDRCWDTTTWVADSRKVRRELGWEPRHDLEDGFRRTVEWYRRSADPRVARAS